MIAVLAWKRQLTMEDGVKEKINSAEMDFIIIIKVCVMRGPIRSNNLKI